MSMTLIGDKMKMEIEKIKYSKSSSTIRDVREFLRNESMRLILISD